MVTNKAMDEGDAGIVAPMFIEPWVFPFESLSFSLRNLSKGLGLGLPMGICWFDEDVVELCFGVMMYLLPSVLSLLLV
jgi:hypothetical protein